MHLQLMTFCTKVQFSARERLRKIKLDLNKLREFYNVPERLQLHKLCAGLYTLILK